MEQETIKEYKRSCHECGKVWHSLVTREEAMLKNNNSEQCDSSLNECAMCGTNKNKTTTIKDENIITTDELLRLKVCPECYCGNYDEEIIEHSKE